MKQLILTLIILNSTITFAQNFKKECDDVPHKIDWIKTKVESLGFTPTLTDKEVLNLDLGTRSEVVVIWVSPRDCVAVGQSLEILQKIKKSNMQLYGVTISFADAFKVNKVLLKDFVLPVNVSINTFLNKIASLDKNPIEALELNQVNEEFKKLHPSIKKVVDEKDIKQTKEKIILLKDKIEKWSLEKALKFKESLVKKTPIQALNDKVDDYERHIVMYDKMRRGLWEDAQKEVGKLKTLNPKLKDEIAKGRENLETILKLTKLEIQGIEKDIQKSFKERKQLLESDEF